MKSKLPTLLLSFIVAMGLWLYVVTTVSPEADQNYTGIPWYLKMKPPSWTGG